MTFVTAGQQVRTTSSATVTLTLRPSWIVTRLAIRLVFVPPMLWVRFSVRTFLALAELIVSGIRSSPAFWTFLGNPTECLGQMNTTMLI